MYAITDRSWRSVAEGDPLVAGETLVASISPALALIARITDMRSQRNELLRATDWILATDTPIPALELPLWRAYRAQLRALPQQPGFPDVEWPRPPQLGDGVSVAAIG